MKDKLDIKGAKHQRLKPRENGGEETRKSFAEGHGITFPNAKEAIQWLKSGNENGLLTVEDIIENFLHTTKSSYKAGVFVTADQIANLIKAQRALTASIKDAEIKRLREDHQIALQMQSRDILDKCRVKYGIQETGGGRG